MLPEIIDTPRLHLRPFQFEDVDDVFAYAKDPEWARFLPVPQPYARSDAVKFIAGQVLLDRETRPTWALQHTGVVIGGVSLRFRDEHQVAELGYSVARLYWGQGLVTEAARAVMAAAFSAHASLGRICARADARNLASLRVMEKLGMIREGCLRQHRLLRGALVDEVWCGVLRSEWETHASG